MAKGTDTVEAFGEIKEALGNSKFTVELDNGITLNNCVISGKIRKNYIKLIPGDRVRMALSIYDLTTGRIEERLLKFGAQNPFPPAQNNKNKKRKK